MPTRLEHRVQCHPSERLFAFGARPTTAVASPTPRYLIQVPPLVGSIHVQSCFRSTFKSVNPVDYPSSVSDDGLRGTFQESKV